MEELVDGRGPAVRLEEVTDAVGWVVLKITGELDISMLVRSRRAIEATFGRGLDLIVLDLSEVRSMDSSGLAMLLALAEAIETVELRNPSGLVLSSHRADRAFWCLSHKGDRLSRDA